MSFSSSNLGVGLGLRPPHYPEILSRPKEVAWFEAIAENYIEFGQGGTGGPAIATLGKIRQDHEIALHGVSLNIGSVDPLNLEYLRKLKALHDRIRPAWISDHLCWTGAHSENLHDLLPLPYTEESLSHLTERVSRVQDLLGRRLLLENVSTYLSFRHSEMTEWEFLSELCARTDCGILLDVNNVYVSSVNLGFDPREFLHGIPRTRVGQMHLGGHSVHPEDASFLIDTHDHAVSDPVWDLYQDAIARFGQVPTLIEWDAEIPSFDRLLEEAARARAILKAGRLSA